jgi:hypothetical protein
MRRVREEVPRLRTERYVWETTTGMNHWASASWFFYLARQRGAGQVSLLKEKSEGEKAVIQATSEGMKMRDLKEIMEEREWN